MNKKIFLSSLLVVYGLLVFPNQTNITGQIPGGENIEIRLLGYSDMLTYTEVILDRNLVDSNGNFSFAINLQETIIAFLDIEFYQSPIFLEPGLQYKIICDTISVSDEFRPYYQKEQLIYSIISDDGSGLNKLIAGFDNSFNEFLFDNFDEIYKRRKKNLIFTFREEIEKRYDSIENEYFLNYINYKFGSIEFAARPVEKPELFMKYFNKKPLLLNNVEFMNLFNQFFNRYITAVTRAVSRRDLINTINYNSNYASLFDTLGKDTLLRNERLRELVMLKGLTELYHNQDYSSQNILEILNDVANKSNFPEHRSIANNCIKYLTKLQKGTLAPQFQLSNLDGDSVFLSDFAGKPVYLSFMTTWSYGCLAEFKLMDTLYRKYKDKIQFITISLDNNIDIVKRFRSEKGYKWVFLYNGNQYDLVNDYKIKTFPVFVLLNAEGKIYQNPAFKPSEVIEESFLKLVGGEE